MSAAAIPLGCPDPADIPADLRQLDRWLTFLVAVDPARPGKLTKRPYNGASCTDPATWCGFDFALGNLEYGRGNALGFALGDGIAGVDLDDVRDLATGSLSPDALAILERLPGAYAEHSPSGRGVKLFCRYSGAPRGGRKAPLPAGGAVELYVRDRMFVVTAAPLADRPVPSALPDMTTELDALFAEYGRQRDPAEPASATGPAPDWGPKDGQPRHDFLCGKSSKLAGDGWPEDAIFGALRGWADQLPGERKTDAELRNMARSAVEKYGRPPKPDPETVEPLPYFTAATVQHRERTAPELLLPGVRLHGRTLVVAPSETGKTWFSLELGAKAAVGGRVCGEWPVPRPVRVLGVFAEDEPDDLEDRAAMLFEGAELDRDLLAQNFRIVADPAFWFGDATARARLFRLVADFRPELILADTVQATSDIKSFKDAEDVTRFYREHMAPLRAAAGGPCGLGLNHHTNKLAYAFDPTTDESGLIHGSDAFRRISDAVVFLRPAGDVPHLPAGGSAFVVSTNKQRVGRRRGSGKHLVFLWPDQVAVAMNKPDHETPVALVYQRELSGDEAARLTRRKRPSDGLLETLAASDAPLTKADLAARLGKKERTVDGYIAEHRDALVLLVREPDGTFRPATDADKTGKTTRPLAYKVAK